MPSERVQRKIDQLLNEAEDALTRQDWEILHARAGSALALDPTNGDAQHYLEAAERGRKQTGQWTAVAAGTASHAVGTVTSAKPAIPSSFASGRYAVKKFLGEGGKKRVYLAHDTTLDRDVAFALIKTEGLDEAARARVIREAQVMGRLGDHPNLMPIFDLGREGDQPFMVLPLMPGGDVEGLIEKAKDHRLPLDRVKEVGIAVCRGLEFAHSHGIIHRDLKPGNVWLTADGTPKIGDFGLALPMERTRLTQAGMMVGTVAYMPPEQALGGEITPKADLYSLGCMLYELVTGRPPFLGDDHVAVIGQHINTPPVAPTWHRQDCPKPLEALVMQLLAKNPGQRPDNAGDVRSGLEALDLREAAPTASPVGQPEAEGGRSLESLAGGVFVGRQRETRELRAALEDALSGQGKVVMLVGEPGIGKTRTALELTTYAGLRRCQVLWGRCYEAQGAPPYWPWVQAIRGYVRNREPDQLRKEMGSGAAEIAEIVPEVRQRLPALTPAPRADSPEQARFRFFDSVTAFLRAAALAQPIVMVLDDLHWADKPSLLLLEFLARELSGARLLVVGTYRDVELSRQHPLADTLGDLNRERLVDRILLRGLSQEDVGKLIEMTTGAKPPAELAIVVHAQTEGNPLFATEVVRLLAQEGRLGQGQDLASPSQKSRQWTIRVPEGVREVIGRRLNRLSARCNEILTVAAVIGREFTLQQLRSAVEDTTEDMVLQAVDEALAARVVEESPGSFGPYAFTHALIRDVLAADLTAARRARMHAHVADCLEKLYGQNADLHAEELAAHLQAAGQSADTGKAIKYTLLAGRAALARHAPENALALFEYGLTIHSGGMDRALADLEVGAGLARLALLKAGEAIAGLRRAYETYVRIGDIAEAIDVAATPLPPYAGLLPGAVELAQSALTRAGAGSTDYAKLLARMAFAKYYQNADLQAARDAYAKALQIAQREGDRPLEFRILVDSAFMEIWDVQLVDALDKSSQAVQSAADGGEAGSMAVAEYAIVLSANLLGRPDVAERHIEPSIYRAREVRQRDWMARAFFGAGWYHFARGDFVRASSFCRDGQQIAPTDARLATLRVLAACLQGETVDARETVVRMVDAVRDAPRYPSYDSAATAYAIAFRYWFAGDREFVDIARDKIDSVISAPRRSRLVELFSRLGLGLLAVAGRDSTIAADQYEWLRAHAQVFPCGTHVERLLALLAGQIGERQLAVAHAESAVSALKQAGYRTELALSLCDAGDLLSMRGSAQDGQRAAAMWDESLIIASELGMKPLIERIIARKKILKA